MANSPKKKSPGSRADEKASAAQRRAARQEKAARQAEALKAQRAAQKRKERLVTGAVVAVVLVLVVGVVWWQTRDEGPTATPDGIVDQYAFTVGEPGAAHEVVVYEDFLCPACGQFEAATGDAFAQAAEEGKVYVKYYPLNFLSRFGDYSERAANAAAVVLDTAGMETAVAFHDELFADQPSEGGDMPDDDWLVEKAVAAGADEDEVRGPIEDMKFEKWVEKATDEASKAGIRQTPTVRLDGQDWNGDVAGLIGALG